MFVMLRLKSAVSGGWRGDWQRGVSAEVDGRETPPTLSGREDTRDKTVVEAVDGQDASDMSDMSASMPSPGKPAGKPGVAMLFGQWGGLRVLRDLRVAVVG
jgi:hypothetical protein